MKTKPSNLQPEKRWKEIVMMKYLIANIRLLNNSNTVEVEECERRQNITNNNK